MVSVCDKGEEYSYFYLCNVNVSVTVSLEDVESDFFLEKLKFNSGILKCLHLKASHSVTTSFFVYRFLSVCKIKKLKENIKSIKCFKIIIKKDKL